MVCFDARWESTLLYSVQNGATEKLSVLITIACRFCALKKRGFLAASASLGPYFFSVLM